MNRMQLHWRRLFAPEPLPDAALSPDRQPQGDPAESDRFPLMGADGHVRTAVLELARPADWHTLSAVWNGVQADLGFPAPAIAVNGRDGIQLWFSLSVAWPAGQVTLLLDALCRHYLRGVAAHRLACFPAESQVPDEPQPPNTTQWVHASPVPALQPNGMHWSAFVASDLAPMFDDEPWLDMPPSVDGQADLLARLNSIGDAELRSALASLAPRAVPLEGATHSRDTTVAILSTTPDAVATSAGPACDPGAGPREPVQFLRDVMNDAQVPLALRIDAAKALLSLSSNHGSGINRHHAKRPRRAV